MSAFSTLPFICARPAAPRTYRKTISEHLEENRFLAPALLVTVCGFLFFYGLGAGELYRNESLRAIVAVGFLRSGNWLVPMLYGEPLFTKPPGMYAAIALVSWPFGAVSEWTARLPSALAASLTVCLIYSYFCRHFGRRAGLIAALILPMNVMWLDKSTTAEIDMMQAAWVAGAIVCFLRALEAAEEGSPSRAQRYWWNAALVCVAGGVLTKWTAPVFFYGTVVPLLWWRGRLRLLLGRYHLVSAVSGAGICLSWIGAAIACTGWHAFFDTVSREAFQRLGPSHHEHGRYWTETLLYPLKLWATNLPWSAVALLALRPGFLQRWDERGKRVLQAMHCWVWPSLVFWSLLPQHTPRYTLPLFGGIAGLAALVCIAWLRAPRRTAWLKPMPALAVCLVLWFIVKIVFVEVVIPQRNLGREPRAKGEQIAALVPKGETLYLSRLKDEGIMFYYARPVRRLARAQDVPSSTEPVFCILDRDEWCTWRSDRHSEVLRELSDEQGAPIVLVKLAPAGITQEQGK
jgi:4-amino-4-deoxy-L-arabinose transferase-like glycosyltransferase